MCRWDTPWSNAGWAFLLTPLADGGLSPVAGRDLKGPTAVLRSVSRIDQELASNGVLLNLKFLPSFFRYSGSIGWFTAFLRGFVDLRIGHVQFNVLGRDAPRAQKNPEQFQPGGPRRRPQRLFRRT
jgi:formate C-acetyltransferase